MSIDNYTNYNLNKYNFGYTWNSYNAVPNNTFGVTPLFNFNIGYTPLTIMPMNPFFSYLTSFFTGGFNPFQFQFQVMNNFNFGNIFNNIQFPTLDLSNNFQNTGTNYSMKPNLGFGELTFPPPSGKYEKDDKPSEGKISTTYNSIQTSSNRKETLLKNINTNDKKFEEQLKEKGVEYDSTLGHNLAKHMISNVTGGTGDCAQFVNDSLEANGINAKRDGHAYTRAEVLSKDSHFTEINVDSADELKELPAGSVIVYARKACRYNPVFGHVVIATGNGSVGSDHIQNSIRYPSNGEGIRVFIPTKAIA